MPTGRSRHLAIALVTALALALVGFRALTASAANRAARRTAPRAPAEAAPAGDSSGDVGSQALLFWFVPLAAGGAAQEVED